MQKISIFSGTSVVMLVTTLLAIFIYYAFMDKQLVIQPGDLFLSTNSTDQVHGGFSTATVRATDSIWVMDYELKAGYEFPFATLILTPNNGFLDLSSYDSILVQAHYVDDRNPQGRIRVQLRNMNPAYTKADSPITIKYNELQYSPANTPSIGKFIWADFRVPSWWLDKVPVPYELARTEVNRVTSIEITTPELAGKGELVLQRIVFQGKRIPPTVFYQFLLAAWLIFIIVVLTSRAFHYDKKERELKAMNEALQINATQFKNKAQTDELTGLFNRFGLHSHLKEALDHVSRNPQLGMSVILADIDFFKQINDTQGHAAGDEVLKRVAMIFKNYTRNNDAVARWGGEEFIILCSKTQLEAATKIAEKLRLLIENEMTGITCSFGVSEWKEGRSISEVIQLADQSLYFSKENGRNQVQTELTLERGSLQ